MIRSFGKIIFFSGGGREMNIYWVSPIFFHGQNLKYFRESHEKGKKKKLREANEAKY